MTELVQFTCNSCSRVSYDTNQYFFGKKSIKCFWCTKYPVKTVSRQSNAVLSANIASL